MDRQSAQTQLAEQLRRILKALQAGDTVAAAQCVVQWQMPDPGPWFVAQFGPATGARLAAEYQAQAGEFVASLTEVLARCLEDGQTTLTVRAVDPTNLADATGLQRLALAAAQRPLVLLSVRLTARTAASGMHLWSWIAVEGRLRWVGKMRALGVA